ncbi:hypothetical protein KHQ81_12540 [Mycoplasmatota bacterium]|nr:hypothetical protein KHQ81_12540 [Mycoplasmatota bacterium]
MYIRMFTYSKNEYEAKNIFKNMIVDIQYYIKLLKYEKIEKYYKFDNSFLIEVTIELSEEFNQKKAEDFFKSISDFWIMFGQPIDNILASKTTIGCNYMKFDIEMINIYLSKEEISEIFPFNSNIFNK